MIISHRHRFIFFAVPKTATHTVREALRPHLGDEDWEQQQLFGRQTLPIPEIARIGHGHVGARRIRAFLDDAMWHTYFKFGFVRNPFDRFVSTCFFLHRDNAQFSAAATTNMKQSLKNRSFRERVLIRPQSLQLTDDAGRLQLDYVGRYESLQADFDEVCRRIGIASSALPRRNASDHDDYTAYYDDELRDSVAEFYRQDLELFEYRYPAS